EKASGLPSPSPPARIATTVSRLCIPVTSTNSSEASLSFEYYDMMRRLGRQQIHLVLLLLAVIALILLCGIVPFIATLNLARRTTGLDDGLIRPQHQRTTAARQINAVDDNDGEDEPSSSDVTQPVGKENNVADAEKFQEKVHADHHDPLNVVVLYADDWSFRTLGAMERALRNTNYKVPEFIKTPNIDALAKNGVLFTHNAVTTSVCSVSRATMYTGQYASVHRSPLPGDTAMFADDKWNETLFPLLHDKGGYRCGMVGKWHHAAPPGVHDTFEMWRAYFGRHYENRDGRMEHVTDLNERDAIDFLKDERRGEGRFALLVSFFAIHAEDGNPEQYRPQNRTSHLYANETVPTVNLLLFNETRSTPKTATDEHFRRLPPFLQTQRNIARERWIYRYKTPAMYQHMQKKLLRMATEVDTAVGNIVSALRERNVLDNTLVIFTADNGNLYGEHGMCEKWYPYEESLRVPLVVYDPRLPRDRRGIANDEFTLNVDLAPTILSAAKIPVPNAMQGRDVSQLYLNPRSRAWWRKEFYYEWFFGGPHDLPKSLAYVRKDAKYIVYPEHSYEELFRLSVDPYEENNTYNLTLFQTSNSLMEDVRGRFELVKSAAERGAKV
ncbi:hypothetical protein ACHAWF_003702, partial [Thalassiosira exigua]